MIDHLGFAVSDFSRSVAFYKRVLDPLGFRLVMEISSARTGAGAHAGFGPDRPHFWIGTGAAVTGPLHVAFEAATRAAVDAFYAAAMAAGARDNGPPGLRAHYHDNYYAAFVLDPDGHNVEAVCHRPAGGTVLRPSELSAENDG
jgi:catechol 2,3-dioxygenase-like lactoylglutathione lyase family enzyme